MTVVDERSRVAPLDREDLRGLAGALEDPRVVAAYLIGSRARDSSGPLSDVDVAVLHEADLTPRDRLDLRLVLAKRAMEALSTSEVDVVLLNGAPPLIRQRSLRDGVRLLDRDPARRIDFQVRTLHEYVDTEPLRQLLSRRLGESIAADTFGRRG
jgi:predicted nucleotidyltransferase